MMIHERNPNVKGVGKWDSGTMRYVPVGGGSRSRLPLIDDPEYRRYWGFVGVDEKLSETLYTIPALYGFLKGKSIVLPGQEGSFTELIIKEAEAKLERQRLEEEEKAKQGG